jgi:hypothetical protein
MDDTAPAALVVGILVLVLAIGFGLAGIYVTGQKKRDPNEGFWFGFGA